MSSDDEYADWGPPADPDEADADAEAETDLGPPAEMRDPLLRDRIRERLGVSPQQWYVIESALLVLPYPLFIAAYLAFGIDQTVFLVVTLGYSLVATYVGFLS